CSAPASGYGGQSVCCSCVVLQKQESSYDSFVAQRDSMLVLLRPNQAQLTLADTADAGASRDLPRPPWRGDASWPLSTARTGWSASATDIKG
ncbi:hypothetical protein ZWY2020_047914, partial [Hordeum vulgare]